MIKLKKRNCPLCGVDNCRKLFSDRNRRDNIQIKSNYVKCNKCKLIYLNPSIDLDKFNEHDEVYFSDRREIKMNLLKRLFNKAFKVFDLYNRIFDTSFKIKRLDYKKNSFSGVKKKVLDIGCNVGNQLKPYYKKGWDVYGVDLSLKSVEMAKKVMPKGEFYCKDFKDLNFKDNTFDLIRANAVWEHLDDPIKYTQICLKMLKKGGKLCLFMPAGNTFNMKFFGKYNVNYWVPFHINLFTHKTIKKLMIESGFKNIQVYYNSPPVYFLLSLRQLFGTIKTNNTIIFEKIFYLILSPFGLLMNYLNMGEELVVIAKK